MKKLVHGLIGVLTLATIMAAGLLYLAVMRFPENHLLVVWASMPVGMGLAGLILVALFAST